MNKELAQHLTQVQKQMSQSGRIGRDDEETTRNNRGIESQRSNDMEVGLMNNIKATAEEMAANEIILHLGIYSRDSSKDCPYVITDAKVNQILTNAPHLTVSNSEIRQYFENEKGKK